MQLGWVKLHRQLLDWEWYSDVNTSRVFFHLLLTANFEDRSWRGETVKRGQRLYGLEQLAVETGLTVSKLRTAISNLKKTGEIANETTPKGSIITITNYERYQSDDKLDDKQIANESQTDDKQIATTKELKKERSKELKKELVIPDGIPLPSNFNLFIQFRKEIKKPITQSQIEGLISDSYKLAKESNCTPEDIFQQSINKGWQGIFNLKDKQNAQPYFSGFNQQQPKPTKHDRIREAADRGLAEWEAELAARQGG